MCVPLAVAAAAVSAAGSLVSGVQGMMQGTYEARIARQNARLEAERGHAAIEAGQIEARDFYLSLSQTKGQQAAAMAANGVDLGFGSPLALQQDTAALGEEDAALLYRNQLERLKGIDIGAANYRAEAAAAKYRGRVGMVNALFKAGSSMMSGFQQQRAIERGGQYPSLAGGAEQQPAMRARLGITGR